jgi:hypothetical protein
MKSLSPEKVETPHIIRDYEIVKVKDLKIGQIFYHDFDNFVFFFSTNKRYVEKFEENRAIVQILDKKEDGSYAYNVKGGYDLNQGVYILVGEHVSEW